VMSAGGMGTTLAWITILMLSLKTGRIWYYTSDSWIYTKWN
jgi:hypothetical protein